MNESGMLSLAELGIVASRRQLERLPALVKLCDELCVDAVGEDAESRLLQLR